MTFVHDQDPIEFVGYENQGQYEDITPINVRAGKSAKQGKNGKDQSSKDKKTLLPIVPLYEGWVITVLDATKPGETASWLKTRKTPLPISSKDLHNKAVESRRLNGSVTRQFQKLGPNQQVIVNRLIAEKNSEEKQPNAVWTLSGVKMLCHDQKSTFRSNKIYDAMRVTLLRNERVIEAAEQGVRNGLAIDDEDIIDLSKPVKATKKDATGKAGDKKKGNKKDNDESRDYNQQDIYEQWPEYAQQQDPFHQYQHQQQQDPFQQHQQQHDPFQQHQQQQQDPFQQHQQQQYQQQQQPHYGDAFNMHGMSGALPNDEGPIPVPAHEYRPEAPMPPQNLHQQPFQPFPDVYPQPDPMEDPRQHDHAAFGRSHFSARRGSHSRPRQEPERENRRESVDSDKIRRKEVRKIGEMLKNEIRDDVREEVRGALQVATAEDKVRRWPTGSSYPPTTSSGQSTGQDDVWSSAASSEGRRYSHGHSTPNTSPDRGDRFYQTRPTGSLHRRDSSGYGSNRQDGRRYYQKRDYVLKPHESPRDRDRDRYRENERGRTPRYIRERREAVDDYPEAPYQRRRDREPRVYVERPHVQRRVTDFAGALPTAEFSRRARNGVDFTDPFVYEDHRERRGGRDRQPQFYTL